MAVGIEQELMMMLNLREQANHYFHKSILDLRCQRILVLTWIDSICLMPMATCVRRFFYRNLLMLRLCVDRSLLVDLLSARSMNEGESSNSLFRLEAFLAWMKSIG